MTRKYISLLLLFSAGTAINAQTVADALRYSYFNTGGTARYVGAGGAFGALGAEFSAVSHNPAGLAMFRSDELIFTPGFSLNQTTAQVRGAANNTPWDDDKTNLNINNLGFVFNSSLSRDSKWKAVNMGIGFNRLANFHQGVYYEGTAPGTLLNGWFDEAADVLNNGGTGDDLYPFGAQLAFDANAIYEQNNQWSYDFIGKPTADIERAQSLVTSGKINELAFSLAGNYNNQLMIGATVGVPLATYRLDAEYTETDPGKRVEFFDRLKYTDFVTTEGAGVNLKVGLIYRLSQVVRLGASVHTPTFWSMTDSFSNTFEYTFTDNKGTQTSTAASPEGDQAYRLRTPLRAMLSGALIAGEFGFLSADVEWVNYAKSRFNLTAEEPSQSNQQYENQLNADVVKRYQSAVNMRFGGELALESFRLRAGYNLLGRYDVGDTGFNSAITAGFGFRFRRAYVDLAYRYGQGEGSIFPYAGGPRISTDNTRNDLFMTVGLKF